ncbi:PREDICTED: stress response protein NST1-like isoform X2 [Ipomoea nil]|nr:PREDICTED: stress response protein NST1-like isoform X2 [Ipomoea nil]XP_019173156.1 PREDICTED: stress response protein NST1-like isoform X2 [Ipomoea nil]
MIKRRFYKLEHGDRDAPSESSSSSSDSEAEAEGTEEEEEYDDEEDEEQEIHSEEEYDDDHKDNDAVTEMGKQNVSVSSSSGNESEDSSGNEVKDDKSGLLTSDDDIGTEIDQKRISQTKSEERDILCGNSEYILKCKSVFKCRICPRVVCLSGETLHAHLNSKRHARSEKLLKEGRLKLMLNDRGKIDGEEEAEEHSPKREQKKTETTRAKGLKKQRPGKESRKENEQYAGTQTGRHRTKNQAKRRRKDDR